MSLLPVRDAQARLLALAEPLAAEMVPIADCAGRWLSEAVVAKRDQPSANLSAMDGYAIRFADMPGPWKIAGESAAGGTVPHPINLGEAMRIFTGAPLPQGADTVLIQEDALAQDGMLSLTASGPDRIGRHVRNASSDFASGDAIIDAGVRLGAAHLALATLAGHGSLSVKRRPRVAIISTGSELIPPGVEVSAGKLPASNAVMLRAMLAGLPCDVQDLGIVADNLPSLSQAFDSARDFDVIVSTGGASVGDHDLVQPAFSAAGGSLDFWKIRMRPGKPLLAGTLDKAVFLGLPGNPVSAFVTGTLFLLPLVRHLSGAALPWPPRAEAILVEPMRAGGERDEYLRGYLDAGVVKVLIDQDSAALKSLSLANALVVRPAGAAEASAGAKVLIIPLDM